jgi:molecular chaperone HtpG
MDALQSADVDLQGLMHVLAHNLYATPEVALRELVQNAHDSCTRRRLEGDTFEPRIDVVADPRERRLIVRDNGAGLTADEIQRYLATIGGGFTRVLREAHDDEGLIGAFGLGFLSAYVVADRVEVITTSRSAPGSTHVFRSRDGIRFSIAAHAVRPVGTEVVLELKPAHAVLAEPGRIQRLLSRYARLLTVPIFAPGRVNDVAPCWRQTHADPRAAHAAVDETAAWFEVQHRVLAAFPLAPVDGVAAGGVVWVHDGATWATSDQRGVTVFVRGMMVSDEAKELLPTWAGFAGAAVESDALVPTASREDLQRDRRWHAVREALRTTLVDGFTRLASERPAVWRRVVRRHNESLIGAALSDPALFDLLRDVLELPTTEGPRTLPEIAADSAGQVAIMVGEDSGYEALLHRAAGRPVVDGSRFGAKTFAERWCAATGRPALVLGTRQADAAVFPPAHVSPAEQAQLDAWFGGPDLRVVASRFQPATVPLVVVPDREVELKRRIEDDATDARLGAGLLALTRTFTDTLEDGPLARVHVNLHHPIVARLPALPPDRAAAVAQVLSATADLSSRTSVDGLDRDLPGALQRYTDALETLLDEP